MDLNSAGANLDAEEGDMFLTPNKRIPEDALSDVSILRRTFQVLQLEDESPIEPADASFMDMSTGTSPGNALSVILEEKTLLEEDETSSNNSSPCTVVEQKHANTSIGPEAVKTPSSLEDINASSGTPLDDQSVLGGSSANKTQHDQVKKSSTAINKDKENTNETKPFKLEASSKNTVVITLDEDIQVEMPLEGTKAFLEHNKVSKGVDKDISKGTDIESEKVTDSRSGSDRVRADKIEFIDLEEDSALSGKLTASGLPNSQLTAEVSGVRYEVTKHQLKKLTETQARSDSIKATEIEVVDLDVSSMEDHALFSKTSSSAVIKNSAVTAEMSDARNEDIKVEIPMDESEVFLKHDTVDDKEIPKKTDIEPKKLTETRARSDSIEATKSAVDDLKVAHKEDPAPIETDSQPKKLTETRARSHSIKDTKSAVDDLKVTHREGPKETDSQPKKLTETRARSDSIEATKSAVDDLKVAHKEDSPAPIETDCQSKKLTETRARSDSIEATKSAVGDLKVTHKEDPPAPVETDSQPKKMTETLAHSDSIKARTIAADDIKVVHKEDPAAPKVTDSHQPKKLNETRGRSDSIKATKSAADDIKGAHKEDPFPKETDSQPKKLSETSGSSDSVKATQSEVDDLKVRHKEDPAPKETDSQETRQKLAETRGRSEHKDVSALFGKQTSTGKQVNSQEIAEVSGTILVLEKNIQKPFSLAPPILKIGHTKETKKRERKNSAETPNLKKDGQEVLLKGTGKLTAGEKKHEKLSAEKSAGKGESLFSKVCGSFSKRHENSSKIPSKAGPKQDVKAMEDSKVFLVGTERLASRARTKPRSDQFYAEKLLRMNESKMSRTDEILGSKPEKPAQNDNAMSFKSHNFPETYHEVKNHSEIETAHLANTETNESSAKTTERPDLPLTEKHNNEGVIPSGSSKSIDKYDLPRLEKSDAPNPQAVLTTEKDITRPCQENTESDKLTPDLPLAKKYLNEIGIQVSMTPGGISAKVEETSNQLTQPENFGNLTKQDLSEPEAMDVSYPEVIDETETTDEPNTKTDKSNNVENENVINISELSENLSKKLKEFADNKQLKESDPKREDVLHSADTMELNLTDSGSKEDKTEFLGHLALSENVVTSQGLVFNDASEATPQNLEDKGSDNVSNNLGNKKIEPDIQNVNENHGLSFSLKLKNLTGNHGEIINNQDGKDTHLESIKIIEENTSDCSNFPASNVKESTDSVETIQRNDEKQATGSETSGTVQQAIPPEVDATVPKNTSQQTTSPPQNNEVEISKKEPMKSNGSPEIETESLKSENNEELTDSLKSTDFIVTEIRGMTPNDAIQIALEYEAKATPYTTFEDYEFEYLDGIPGDQRETFDSFSMHFDPLCKTNKSPRCPKITKDRDIFDKPEQEHLISLKERCELFKARKEELEKQVISLNESLDILKSQKEEMEKQVISLNESLDILKSQKEEMEKQVISLNESLDIFKSQKEEVEKHVQEKLKALVSLKEQLSGWLKIVDEVINESTDV